MGVPAFVISDLEPCTLMDMSEDVESTLLQPLQLR